MRRIDRREFLGTASVATLGAVTTACGSLPLGFLRTGSALAIDPHCHVFNASDLPVKGFVRRVLIQRHHPAIVDTVIDRLLQSRAPGFEEEMRTIERSLAGRSDESASNARRHLREVSIDPSEDEIDDFLREVRSRDSGGDAQLGSERVAAPASEEAKRIGARLLLRWIRLLQGFRTRIVQELIDTYPGVTLFTPALVDFDRPLDDTSPTSWHEQLELYPMISQLFQGRIHPMVGYDPFRAIEDESTLTHVQRAVRSGGFAGVKLYPPMGFKPIGNDDPSLDRVLSQLYDWVVSERVPILAHCNSSNGARPEFEAYASPDRWEEVLKQPRWRELPLCLGHFGGVANLLAQGRSSWAAKIVRLMDCYPHVYADVGYHDIAFSRGHPQEERFYALLGELSGESTQMLERVMYGSDWEMIAIQRGHEDYRETYVDRWTAAFGAPAGGQFAGANALRFLGLRPGEAGHARIQEFHPPHTRLAWLDDSRFDGLTTRR